MECRYIADPIQRQNYFVFIYNILYMLKVDMRSLWRRVTEFE